MCIMKKHTKKREKALKPKPPKINSFQKLRELFYAHFNNADEAVDLRGLV